jgi:glyceraldehyde-3-phosphate dehydrogenase/erythrose-4-phosphate dehydrogenase
MAMSLRIPTMVVNALLADLLLARPPREADQAAAALARAAENELAGVLDLERGFLGASRAAADFCGNPHSAVVDLNWLALSGPMLRLLIWHDNEYAYCRRVADTLEVVARRPA